MRAVGIRSEFNPQQSLISCGSGWSGEPGHHDQPVLLQFHEPPVVSVTTPVPAIVEEERFVDFRHHQELSWFGKPKIKSLSPGLVQRGCSSLHLSLDSHAVWSSRKVWWTTRFHMST